MNPKINRRNLIIGGSAAAVTAVSKPSAFAGSSLQSSDKDKDNPAAPKNGKEALERLLAGNERFISGKLNHPHTAADWRKRLVGGQNPFVTILGCADSRVPPELLFDQGFGDLFVIRVAGNVIDTDLSLIHI